MLTVMDFNPYTPLGVYDVTSVELVSSGWILPRFSVSEHPSHILKINCSGDNYLGKKVNITLHLHFFGDACGINYVEGSWVRQYEYKQPLTRSFNGSESIRYGLNTYEALDSYIRAYNYQLKKAIKNDEEEICGRDAGRYLNLNFSKVI